MSTRIGRRGEDMAARHLQRLGYRILERNVRGGRGELDLVALKGDLLVFIEVKAHRNRESALLAMDEDKCARIVSAAKAWLSRHPQYAALQCRFDLIMLTPMEGWRTWFGPRVEHIKDIIR